MEGVLLQRAGEQRGQWRWRSRFSCALTARSRSASRSRAEGSLRQELVPCLLGSLQAGYVRVRPLVVGLQMTLVGFTDGPPHL